MDPNGRSALPLLCSLCLLCFCPPCASQIIQAPHHLSSTSLVSQLFSLFSVNLWLIIKLAFHKPTSMHVHVHTHISITCRLYFGGQLGIAIHIMGKESQITNFFVFHFMLWDQHIGETKSESSDSNVSFDHRPLLRIL